LVQIGLPTLLLKILGPAVQVTDPLWPANRRYDYPVDQVVPTTYNISSGFDGQIFGYDSAFVANDKDNNTKFQIDYSGNVIFGAGIQIQSRHSLTGTVNVLSTDTYIGCTATSAVTVNLPKAIDVGAGKMLIIKSETGSSTVTIIPFAGDTCDTASLSTAQVTRLISNGVSRWIAI